MLFIDTIDTIRNTVCSADDLNFSVPIFRPLQIYRNKIITDIQQLHTNWIYVLKKPIRLSLTFSTHKTPTFSLSLTFGRNSMSFRTKLITIKVHVGAWVCSTYAYMVSMHKQTYVRIFKFYEKFCQNFENYLSKNICRKNLSN